MTLLPLRRPDADDATLLRRARRGDRRAHRLFARRHAARAVELVELLVDAPAESATLAAAVLDATIAAGVPGDDALVRCAVATLAPATDEAGLARVVVALTDVEGRTEDTVAALIDRSVDEVADLRAAARSALGATRAIGSDCRGWALAARRDRLTISEQEAANGHLSVCRSCRGRLDEQQRTREKLRRSGTAVSAVVVADVVALSVPTGGAVAGASGIASLVLGKAGVATVGAAAVAIAATSAGVAAARHSPSHHGSSPDGTRPAVVQHENGNGNGNAPSAVTTVPHNVDTGAPGGQASTVPSTTPTTTRLVPLPLPSPLATPSILPSVSVTPDLPLPTNVTSVAPLPTVSAIPTLPVTLPTSVIATATSLLGH